jgi:four helix bundle protein
MAFSFERLDVYCKSLDLFQEVEQLCTSLKGKTSFSLLDQLNRAALSVSLNIAEGNGRWHKKDKQRFFWIARGSVFEVVPVFQILFRKQLITETVYLDLYNRSQDLSKMLFKLIQSVETLNQN